MPVHIITDSGSDITGASSSHLTVLPLSIAFGATTYADGVDLTHERFYQMLDGGGELPTTGQVTPYAFSQELEQVRAAGDEAVIVTLSSKLSGTYQSAVTAAADFPGAQVVDSLNATVGERILVERALALAGEGRSAAEVAARLEQERTRICLVALLDTLEFLQRGGRIPKSVGTIGQLLSIKPVIGVADGEVVMLGKARGSKNGRNLLQQEVEKSGIDFTMPLALGYSGLSDRLLRTYLEDNRGIWEGHACEEDLPVVPVGATIGTHAGPGAIVLAFFREE